MNNSLRRKLKFKINQFSKVVSAVDLSFMMRFHQLNKVTDLEVHYPLQGMADFDIDNLMETIRFEETIRKTPAAKTWQERQGARRQAWEKERRIVFERLVGSQCTIGLACDNCYVLIKHCQTQFVASLVERFYARSAILTSIIQIHFTKECMSLQKQWNHFCHMISLIATGTSLRKVVIVTFYLNLDVSWYCLSQTFTYLASCLVFVKAARKMLRFGWCQTENTRWWLMHKV